MAECTPDALSGIVKCFVFGILRAWLGRIEQFGGARDSPFQHLQGQRRRQTENKTSTYQYSFNSNLSFLFLFFFSE